MSTSIVFLAAPLPSSPTRGEVPRGVFGAIAQEPLNLTLPFMGRVGEGTWPPADLSHA
jgi:hypothetical protein